MHFLEYTDTISPRKASAAAVRTFGHFHCYTTTTTTTRPLSNATRGKLRATAKSPNNSFHTAPRARIAKTRLNARGGGGGGGGGGDTTRARANKKGRKKRVANSTVMLYGTVREREGEGRGKSAHGQTRAISRARANLREKRAGSSNRYTPVARN